MVAQAANGGMMLVYAVTVGVGYGSHGRLVAGFLPASLPDGIAKRAVGLGLCYHIAVSALETTREQLHLACCAVLTSSRVFVERVRAHRQVSYLLCFQPLGEKVHSMIWPDTAILCEARGSNLARSRHLMISVVCSFNLLLHCV